MPVFVNDPDLYGLWRMEEPSGGSFAVTRRDSNLVNNENPLTDVNTCLSSTDRREGFRSVRLTRANSERLTHIDNAALSTGDIDFTLLIWLKIASKPSTMGIISRWANPGGSNAEYLLFFNNGTDRLTWQVTSDGAATGRTSVAADQLGSPALDTWYFVEVTHENGVGISIKVDNGPADTAPHIAGVHDSSSQFIIGVNEDNLGQHFDGNVDAVAFLKRLLSPEESTSVFESGIQDVPTAPIIAAPPPPSFHQSKDLSIIVESPLIATNRNFVENVSYLTTDYSHELRAIGGYWSARFGLSASQSRIDDWIQNGIGRHIEVFDHALVNIFEGFVTSVSATLGPLVFRIGPLLDMGNRIKVVYSTVDTSTTPPTTGVRAVTALANDTDSQTLYGIIEKILSVGGATATDAGQIRDTWLLEHAELATSRQSSLSSRAPKLDIEVLGYWHWLKAFSYSETTSGDQDLDAKMQAVISGDPNSIFSTDFSRIDSNTLQVPQYDDDDRIAEVIIKELNSRGDSSDNRYNVGVYAGRQFIYEQAPAEIEYEQRIRGNTGVTDRLGGRVEPWNVLPAKWIFYPDFLIGRNPPVTAATLKTDPRAGFVETVKYTFPNQVSINGGKFGQFDQQLAKLGLAGVGT
jgi:hypothetical protein